MRFSRTNMRLAAARLPDLSREIDAQAAEFSITHFCPRNPGLTKSTTYARETAKIGRSLFKSSLRLIGNPRLERRFYFSVEAKAKRLPDPGWRTAGRFLFSGCQR